MKLEGWRLAAVVVASALGGVAGGCLLSDYAALSGFPHEKLIVELEHDGSPRAAYECQRLSNAFGPELSFFDEKAGAQSRCVLEVAGETLPDGSMLWYPGYLTWYGRVIQNHPPAHITKSRIKAVRAARS